MRVVSTVPAATEIVAALGELRALVGISHECDFPPGVRHLPRVTTTSVDLSASGPSIDAEVRRLRQSGKPVVAIAAEELRRLAPDLIITQDLCEVCAASDGQLYRLASTLRPAPRVLSLQARDLPGIWVDIRSVGAALQLEDEAEELVLGLQSRLRRLRSSQPQPPPRVACVEWLEPLFLAGHWVPELIAAAGGIDVGAAPGSHSAQRSWEEVAALDPDLIIVMLCGFTVERARAELDSLSSPEALEQLRTRPTWIIDGNAYTSRPGPRVVDGAALIQLALWARASNGLEEWQPSPHDFGTIPV
jgi:iron complex transport system substrate-binding protein